MPFPYDPIASLADALELLTESLFSIEPRPSTHNSVLTGGLVRRETLWRGCLTFRWRGDALEEPSFVFPAHKPLETWPAGPFVFIDPNKRPYVLTRLKDRDAGTWEYTRYRAEANSVISDDSEAMLAWVPAPAENEYEQTEDRIAEAEVAAPESDAAGHEEPTRQDETAVAVVPSETPKRLVTSFGEAIEAVRQGDFEAAIPFLEKLVQERPNYHIGWLRLGYAQRERAVRLATEAPAAAMALLDGAYQSFTRAIGHVDQEYRASAYYERSKTFYRKYVVGGEKRDAELAVDDAQEACVLSSDSQFQSWNEYLNRLLARSVTTRK